jgi:hypothetical protein
MPERPFIMIITFITMTDAQWFMFFDILSHQGEE